MTTPNDTPDLLRPTPPDHARILKKLGCTPIPPHDTPTHWNPWDGTGAVHWSILEDRIVDAIITGRRALLKTPYWRTSEWWMAIGPVFLAPTAGGIALSGFAGDILPPPLDKWVAGLCTALGAIGLAGYKFSTTLAKHLKDEEKKDHAPEEKKT